MARLRLQKLLRGSAGAALEGVMALCDEPVAVRDGAGRLLFGADPGQDAAGIPITVDGEHLGDVVGGPSARTIANLITHLGDRELEKLQLANETLGRYKELTLLYDVGDRLSRTLEPGDVAEIVVSEAQRAVGGTSCALYIHDQRTGTLVALARSSSTEPAALPATSGLEGRVLRTGHAEFLEEIDTSTRVTLDSEITSLICAPIRSGERVVGVLRVANTRPAAWTSSDLKLVTSLAAQATAALQGAELHTGRLREVALKHQLQRYVSPHLLDAVTEGARGGHLALVFCDLSSTRETGDSPDALAVRMEARLTRAISLLMAHGGVVDLPQGEMVLAVFHCPSPEAAAEQAVQAAVDLVAALADGRTTGQVLGAGVAAAALGEAAADALGDAISAAALLQSAAAGRLLVDDAVAAALQVGRCEAVDVDLALPGSRTHAHEVRP